MSWIRLCSDGLELNAGNGDLIKSVAKKGNVYPLGALLDSQDPPGNLVFDPGKKIRQITVIKTGKPTVIWWPSGNFSSRQGTDIDEIVLHMTVGNAAGSLSWLCNRVSGVSAHYLVARDGKIYQLAHDAYAAWHCYGENQRSIGIENEANPGQNLTEAQEKSLIALCQWLIGEYKIPLKHVNGHTYTRGSRGLTACPGTLFGSASEQAVRAWVDKNLRAA